MNTNNKVWGNRLLQFNCSNRRLVHAFCIHHWQQNTFKLLCWITKRIESTLKQPSCKKGAAHAKKTAWKKLWNPRWQPRSGCDGRIIAKFLITTIQVNLVPIPSEVWRRQHKFTWIVAIKKIAIILPSHPLLGRHLKFHNFFHAAFF